VDHEQIFSLCRNVQCLSPWGVLSDERTGVPFVKLLVVLGVSYSFPPTYTHYEPALYRGDSDVRQRKDRFPTNNCHTAEPYLKRLVAGFPSRRPWVRARFWSSWICGGQSGAGSRFSPSTLVSPANLHSTKFSIIIITRGRYKRPFSGRRAEWTQFGLHPPPPCELKKFNNCHTKKLTIPMKGHVILGCKDLHYWTFFVDLITKVVGRSLSLCEVTAFNFKVHIAPKEEPG
jgi:hypothetical protein